MGTGEFNARGNPAMDPIQGGVEILLVASCNRNRGDKRRPDGPCRLVADFNLLII